MKRFLYLALSLITVALTYEMLAAVPSRPTELNSEKEANPTIKKSVATNFDAAPGLARKKSNLSKRGAGNVCEDTKNSSWVFYDEKFTSMQNINPNIQQTLYWKYVADKGKIDSASIAKKKNCFSVQSKVTLKYVFSVPLCEFTKYQYSLCCSVKGDGKIIMSPQVGSKISKEFAVKSESFETKSLILCDGNSLNRRIVPSISFQGDLQVKSITLLQKEINPHRTICLGQIESISRVPDIKKSNYPDCYYTAKFVVKDILDGRPVPQNIQLLIPAFLNNKIDPLSKLMKKGNWRISIRPFSLASKNEQEIEQVDEIESYLFTPYILVAAVSIGNIPELTVSAIPILEGEKYDSPYDTPINPPLPEQYKEISKNEIEREREKVNMIIEQAKEDHLINAEYQSAWDVKQKSYEVLDSSIIWAKVHNSFFALPKKWCFIESSKRISKENVDAIVELNHFFQSQGIQFILQIVPDYRDIAALVLNPEFQKYGDQKSARTAKQLLERGIEVQYISDEIVKNAFKYERLFFYPRDFHPDEGTTDIMTDRMARRLEKYGNLVRKDLDAKLFSKQNRDTGYGKGLTWPKNVDIGSHKAGSNVQVPYILYNKKDIYQNPNSNILVFGNSFAMEPMTHDAYISYLAPKILHVCSCYLMGGTSVLTALPQLFLSFPEKYLKNKRIAILSISISYLTGSYTFLNVSRLNAFLKSKNKQVFLGDIPLRNNCYFTSSFVSVPKHLAGSLFFHPSAAVLSRSRPKILLKVPDDFKDAKTVRISFLPCCESRISLLINGEPHRLPSQFIQKWEILEVELNNKKNISIEMDPSSYYSVALVGNVSFFK